MLGHPKDHNCGFLAAKGPSREGSPQWWKSGASVAICVQKLLGQGRLALVTTRLIFLKKRKEKKENPPSLAETSITM